MDPQPCRLLALPAELRLRIYSFALAPTGSIYLHRTPSKRHAVTPSSISPALLATNHQIHSEATGVLYVENTVHIAVDAHDTAWPAINEARLPQPVLQRLEHLCVLLDCSAVLWGRYGSVDFGAFTALTALKTLRLRVLALPDERDEDGDGDDGQDPNQQGNGSIDPPAEPTWKFPNFALLAVEILERVPASTKIMYGPDEDGTRSRISTARRAKLGSVFRLRLRSCMDLTKTRLTPTPPMPQMKTSSYGKKARSSLSTNSTRPNTRSPTYRVKATMQWRGKSNRRICKRACELWRASWSWRREEAGKQVLCRMFGLTTARFGRHFRGFDGLMGWLASL